MQKSLLAGGALAVILATGTASADHQWGNYHWARTSNPLALQVKVDVGSQWSSSIATAVDDWNQSNVLSLTATNTNVDTRKCNPISGQVLVCADSYGQRGWLGIASIWATGDHITQGTTKLNDTYYSASYAGGYYDTPAWRALVACQEIGHDFGLGHQDENFDNANLNTCMDYTSNPESNQHPNTHDYQLLSSMYSHLDSFDTADPGGGGGGGGGGGDCPPKAKKCNANGAFAFRDVGATHPSSGQVDPGSWGQAVGRDGEGRANKFVLDLGGGVKRITHVFWVPGFRPQPHHHHD